MIQKYQIPNFLDFLSKYKFTHKRTKHTAELVWEYYNFSYHQILSLDKTYNSFFKEDPSKQDEITFYLRKSWSYAYGMYSLLRTTLEALNTMNKMIGNKIIIDELYKKEIKNIIDIANDIVKHPTFKHNAMSTGAQPATLSLNGEIDIVIISDTGTITKKEIDPMEDFYIITKYIEYVARLYLSK